MWVSIFFHKVHFQILLGYMEDPIFLLLKQCFGEFKWVLCEIAPSLSFSLLSLPCIFRYCNDKDPFHYFKNFFFTDTCSSSISLSCFLRRLSSTLSWAFSVFYCLFILYFFFEHLQLQSDQDTVCI